MKLVKGRYTSKMFGECDFNTKKEKFRRYINPFQLVKRNDNVISCIVRVCCEPFIIPSPNFYENGKRFLNTFFHDPNCIIFVKLISIEANHKKLPLSN